MEIPYQPDVAFVKIMFSFHLSHLFKNMVKIELFDKLNQEQTKISWLYSCQPELRLNVCFLWGKAPGDNFALISACKLDLRLGYTYASAHYVWTTHPDLILIVLFVIIEPTGTSVSSCTVVLIFKFGAFNVVWFIDFLTGHNGFYARQTAELCFMLANCLNRDICGIRLFQGDWAFHCDPLNLQILCHIWQPDRLPIHVMDHVKGI
jgi:hypothetical protein